MTLPDERYRAVMWAERFLQELATDRKKYPRIPNAVRKEAFSILRHFPSEWDMKNASDLAPVVFQERLEPLYKMVKQYEQDKENDN
jgi:hypothetical protein